MSVLAQQAAANKNVLVGNKVDPATTKYAMLVKRVVEGEDRERVFGLLLAGVSEKSVNGGSATYEFKGVLVDENGNVIGNIRNGDGIAFNYRGTEGSDNMVYEYWNTHAISIESISGKKVEFFPNEWTKVAYYDAADYDAAGVVGTPKISGVLSVALQGNTLQVSTVRAGFLKIQVFDMVGHVVESLNENVPAGNFAYTFGKMGKGAYIVRVQQGAMVRTIRK